MGKSIIIITMVVVGAIIAIIRFIKNEQSKSSAANALKRIQDNPAKAEEYARKLDCFLGRYESENPRIINELIKVLEANKQMGKYTIHGTYRLMNGSYLIVTKCTDQDYGMTPGRLDTVTEVFHINFLAIYKQPIKELVIQSHQYTNRAEERLLKEFPKAAFKLLEEKNAQA